MCRNKKIVRVTFRTGMVNALAETSKCPTVTFSSPDIPADILKQVREDDYESLKLSYGDPSWGSPIQYDYMEVESSARVKPLEIFNRAILLLTRNTEETRRAHRIMYSAGKHMQAVYPPQR